MTRLIDADALLKEIDKNIYSEKIFGIYDIITNAPAIKIGDVAEFQATTDLLCLHADNLKLRDGFKWLLDAIDENIASVNPYKVMEYQELLSTPPQPQTVKDALEKAAKLCNDKAKDYKEFAESFAANICSEIEDEIRALIEE